jgi:hypothetical protein
MEMIKVRRQENNFIVQIPQESALTEQLFTQLRFQLLAEKWKEESKYLAFAKDSLQLPNYQAIINMGKMALPHILADMQQQPNHWFSALKAITGENPVLPEHKGNIQSMTNDWLLWGRKNQIEYLS